MLDAYIALIKFISFGLILTHADCIIVCPASYVHFNSTILVPLSFFSHVTLKYLECFGYVLKIGSDHISLVNDVFNSVSI